MEGNAIVPDSEKQGVDERFRMFYTADNCSQCGKKKCGEYTAVPPLARCFHWNNSGFGPVDYFGRTLVEKLDPSIKSVLSTSLLVELVLMPSVKLNIRVI